MSTRTKLLAAVGALAALVLLLSRGGEESSAQLQALQDDPMATYVPDGGTLVDTDSRNEGTSLGEPVSAQYTRMFELSAAASARALEQAREAALAAGWTQPGTSGERGFLAERRAPSGRLELAVTEFRNSLLLPDDVTPPALQVSLRHLGS
ncbi:MAG TPA: hypothetical protein VEW11_06640 [Gaiellaceae bacterium]|nr:hypothetical protein [Gaiellaceae bacterium]